MWQLLAIVWWSEKKRFVCVYITNKLDWWNFVCCCFDWKQNDPIMKRSLLCSFYRLFFSFDNIFRQLHREHQSHIAKLRGIFICLSHFRHIKNAELSYIHFVLTKRQIAVYLNSTEQIQLIQLQNEVTLQSIAMHDGYGRCFHFWLWNWIRLTISGKFLVLIFGTMTVMAMMPRGKNSYAIDINI